MAEGAPPEVQRLRVITGERGVVRVFAAPTGAPGWAKTDAADWPLPAALGVETLGADDVQVFEVTDLAQMRLGEFLAQGYDIASDQIDHAALDAVEGTIAVVRSTAFAETPVTLDLAPGVTCVGAYAEPGAQIASGPMGDFASARPRKAAPAAPPPEDDRPVDDGARVVATFHPSREAYIRSHLWLGAAAMGIATAVLYWMGNPDYWVGAVAGVLAIAVRGVYLASEELGRRFELTETSVRTVSDAGGIERSVALGDIEMVRRLGSAVQVVTKSGDKYLMKYIGAPADVQQRIAAAAGVTL
ncbi:MAG: hypothetical protein AAGB05_09850 [Pseudomonadota bacterium]